MSSATPTQSYELERLPRVKARTGMSGTTIWRSRRAGDFPAPIQIGPKSVAWLSHEIDAWIAARVAARDASVPPAGGR